MDVRKKIVQDFPNFYQISSISIPRSLEALRTHFFVRGSDFGLCGFGTQACPENQYEQISKYICFQKRQYERMSENIHIKQIIRMII